MKDKFEKKEEVADRYNKKRCIKCGDKLCCGFLEVSNYYDDSVRAFYCDNPDCKRYKLAVI